jgi:hypothetical protein
MDDWLRTAFRYSGRPRSSGISEHATDYFECDNNIGDTDNDIAADDDVRSIFDRHLSAFITQLTDVGGTQGSIERVGKLLSAVHGKNIAGDVDR